MSSTSTTSRTSVESATAETGRIGMLPRYAEALEESCRRVRSDRDGLYAALGGIADLGVVRSEANFLLCRLPEEAPDGREVARTQLEVALLKGRGNYLCLYRMDQARKDGRLPSRDSVAELEAIRQWAPTTLDGDLSISAVMAEDSELWPYVTSTTENCLGSDCPDFEACFVARARREDAVRREVGEAQGHVKLRPALVGFFDIGVKQVEAGLLLRRPVRLLLGQHYCRAG